MRICSKTVDKYTAQLNSCIMHPEMSGYVTTKDSNPQVIK